MNTRPSRHPSRRPPATRRAEAVAATGVLAIVLVAVAVWVDAPLSRAVRESDVWLRQALGALSPLGESQWYLVPAGLGALICAERRRRARGMGVRRLWAWGMQAAGFVFASVAVSGILVIAIKVLVGRARPKLLDMQGAFAFNPFTLDASFHSFPSGHANTMLALGFALAFLLPRYRVWFITLACVTALSRVAVNAHYLSDVLAGGALAVLTTTWLHRVFAAREWAFKMDRSGYPRLAAPGRWIRLWLARRLGAGHRRP